MNEKLNKFNEEYNKKNVLYIYSYFSSEQLDLLHKMKLKIEDKKYTVYEFDVLGINVRQYITKTKLLKEMGIQEIKYNEILDIFDKISKDFNI